MEPGNPARISARSSWFGAHGIQGSHSTMSHATIDDELKRLAFAHYALAAAELVGAAIIVVHADLLGLATRPLSDEVLRVAGMSRWVLVAVATPVAIYLGAMAPLTLVAGRRIVQRRSLRFCIAVGRANVLFIPWGTLVSLYSSLLLSRRSVADRFHEGGV